ncbi:hypothetical protein AJ85_12295 [Alkalihalobacillus alcalophilus ATCC 27647 = CGMCC 1.3604]|uniref:Transposase n=1 Tax=Alkalihalobacillus alcalophilus ATCC 27647 = CGMCC 1.3604 TaxID=1218173 RepID=A0A4S4JY79_ALKAL|nr:hypothetical protein [Alkalihalobacillus alcalophilus]MED1563847.1 hypothetical protein [Alkalihalobacillus alcalophilus]THG90174.1 hypothetical protein AJ85_12295 [Alkalihalobacillus alcalophilus ATCC 27647 = CGMCC 1.3604]
MKEAQKHTYSEDEILAKAIEQVKKGGTYEEVRNQFNLSADDII